MINLNPKCNRCGCQLYGEWPIEPQPKCRKCRLLSNPMTIERLRLIFENHNSVSDGTFHFWMNTATGQISGSCSEGTCDFEYDNLEDFVQHYSLDELEEL